METLSILLDRLKSGKEKKDTVFSVSRVKNEIDNLSQEYLKSSEDVFIFEVRPNILGLVIEAIDKEPLSIKYNISQISETKFSVSLQDFGL